MANNPFLGSDNLVAKEAPSDFAAFISSTLNDISNYINTLLIQIQNEGSITAILMILVVSFAYGAVHAAGPGHGKTLVASYFLSSNHSYKKAISMSLLIAIVHTFSALILTLVLYFLIDTVFSVALQESTQAITIASALLIVGIGAYLLFTKTKAFLQERKKQKQAKMQFFVHKPSCSCASCKSPESTDLGVILGAGIIPCPGTITIFLFTLTLKMYMIGFVSAVFMSLGMGFIIALTAIISTKVRKSSQKSNKAFLVLDFGSVFLILSIGFLLLYSTV